MNPELELDLRMSEPTDDGSVIRIKVAFPESPKTHTYAAIGFDGTWYLSGAPESTRKTWDELINWFKSRNIEVLSIALATSWEEVL